MKKQRATITIIVLCSIFFMFLGSQLALAGDGKIAFSKVLGDIFQIVVTDENGQNQINLSKSHANDINPVWSPDGQYIAFVSDRNKNQARNDEIYIMNVDGSDQRRITNNPAFDSLMPSFSPDGRRLAFTRVAFQDPNPDHKIFVININGQDEKFLTDGAAPNWSPDGKKIAFCKKPANTNWHIYLMDTYGNNQVNITSDLNDTYPSWSPDGKQIIFSSQRAKFGFSNIYKMDSDGQNVVRLTQADNEQHVSPIWSPDGQYIAFSNLQGINPGGVEVIKADGSEPKIISDGTDPSWFDSDFVRKYAVNPLSKISKLWGKLKEK